MRSLVVPSQAGKGCDRYFGVGCVCMPSRDVADCVGAMVGSQQTITGGRGAVPGARVGRERHAVVAAEGSPANEHEGVEAPSSARA